MALQCVKDAGPQVHNAAELDAALTKIKQKLLASRRPDGHIGNEFSTGLAVQVKIFFLIFFVSFAAWNFIQLNLLICCVLGLIGTRQPSWRVCCLHGGHEERRPKQHVPQPHDCVSDPACSPPEVLPGSKNQELPQWGRYVQRYCCSPLFSGCVVFFVTLCFFLQKLWCWSLQILSWFYQVRLKWLWWWRWWRPAARLLITPWMCQRAVLCWRPWNISRGEMLASRECLPTWSNILCSKTRNWTQNVSHKEGDILNDFPFLMM